MLIEGIFHLILHIVKGNQNEGGDGRQQIHNPGIVQRQPIVQFIVQGGGIDDWVYVNKYQTIGPDRNRSPVIIDRHYVGNALVHILHEAENFNGRSVTDLLRILLYEKEYLMDFTIQFFVAARFGAQVINHAGRNIFKYALNLYFLLRINFLVLHKAMPHRDQPCLELR